MAGPPQKLIFDIIQTIYNLSHIEKRSFYTGKLRAHQKALQRQWKPQTAVSVFNTFDLSSFINYV